MSSHVYGYVVMPEQPNQRLWLITAILYTSRMGTVPSAIQADTV